MYNEYYSQLIEEEWRIADAVCVPPPQDSAYWETAYE